LQADLKKEDDTVRFATADLLDPDPDYQTLTWALDRELEFNWISSIAYFHKTFSFCFTLDRSRRQNDVCVDHREKLAQRWDQYPLNFDHRLQYEEES
jgi:hypothetical protein